MLGRIRVDEAIPLLGDLLDRGQAMVANVPWSIGATELLLQLHICARSRSRSRSWLRIRCVRSLG